MDTFHFLRLPLLFETAFWWSVQFREAKELDAAEGKLPVAHVLQNIVHSAAIPINTHANMQAHRQRIKN